MLKIKISKSNLTQAADARPGKRRAQRVAYSDDEDAGGSAGGASYGEGPRKKKARTTSRGNSADYGDNEDVDVDVDGDYEDTRFPADSQPSASRSISPATASVKLRLPGRQKEKEREREKPTKQGKPLKKPKRSVVYTDSEEDYNEEQVVVVTSDDDFEPDAEQSSFRKGTKGKSGKVGKASSRVKAIKMEEEESEEDVPSREERRVFPPQFSSTDTARREVKNTVDPLDEPMPKKRKLPPIKKNKQLGSSSTGPSTPAVHRASAMAPAAAATANTEKKESLTPAPTSNQVGQRKLAGASSDINLLDSSVYSELFRSTPGTSTPNSGLNRKQKEEERRKELNKMRDEARAKREAEAKHAFDLQAGPDKIQRYDEMLRCRQSMARFPNILGAAVKEYLDRRRDRL